MTERDDNIIKKVQSGDTEAYAELVRRHHQSILRLCRSMLGGGADAEDAAQESFIKAYRSLAGYQGQASFSTWIYRIASNKCLDVLRKRGRERAEPLEAAGELAEPVEDLESREQAAALLSELSPEYRLALTLRELQGFTYEEIAETMNCSLDSVKARLRRARAELARHFLVSRSVQ